METPDPPKYMDKYSLTNKTINLMEPHTAHNINNTSLLQEFECCVCTRKLFIQISLKKLFDIPRDIVNHI